jgi:hypothetical protein
MPTKGYQKYVRNGRTDAFLGLDLGREYCQAGGHGFAEDKGN